MRQFANMTVYSMHTLFAGGLKKDFSAAHSFDS